MNMRITGLVILVASSMAFSKNLALKNFLEIYSSLQVSTQVNPNTAILEEFKAVRNFLPMVGKVDEYTSPMQFGLIRIAGVFCQERVLQDSKLLNEKRVLHHGVDFTKSPYVLPLSQRIYLIEEYAGAFWQRVQTKEEETQLLAAYSELASETSDAIQFFTFFCTSVASSIDFLTI